MEFLRRNKKPEESLRQPSLMQGQDDYTFRRSRTITGSLSSGVKSAAEDRSHLQSPRLKLHQLKRHQKGVFTGLVISLVGVIGLGWMVGQYVLLPANFTYQDQLNGLPDTATYKTAIDEYYNQRPTERFLFQLDQKQLSSYVAKKHPEVKSVRITSPAPGVFDVIVEFRQPVVSWNSSNSQIYVDNEGAPFYINHFMEPSVEVEDQSGVKLEATNTVASSRFIEFLGRIVSGVNASGVSSVEKVIIPAGSTRQVDLRLNGKPYPIKTHIDREPTAQAYDVVSAVRHLDSKGVVPQYLDVRVAGKAFYK